MFNPTVSFLPSGFGGTGWAFAVAFIAEAAGIGLYAWSGETHQHGGDDAGSSRAAAADKSGVADTRRGMMGIFQRLLALPHAAGERKRPLGKEAVEVGEDTALLGTAVDMPHSLLNSSDSSHGSILSVELSGPQSCHLSRSET